MESWVSFVVEVMIMGDFAAARRAMVDSQVRPSDVTRFPIIKAMLEIAREAFVPPLMQEVAYSDVPIRLTPQADRTILDARTFGKMLDAVNIQPDELVLDIGAGFGYSAAVIGKLAEAVVAVEEIPEIAEVAETRLITQGVDNVLVTVAPLCKGDPRFGPYDVVVLEGAIERLPESICPQLKEGGRIVALVRDNVLCRCRLGTKSGQVIHWRNIFDSGAPTLPGFELEESFELNWKNS